MKVVLLYEQAGRLNTRHKQILCCCMHIWASKPRNVLWFGQCCYALVLPNQASVIVEAVQNFQLTCSSSHTAVINAVLVQEEGMDEGVGEMRFKLPGSASPGAMLFLLAGCREVARAGGHSAGTAAVRLLQWQLSHAVLQAFRCDCFAKIVSCVAHNCSHQSCLQPVLTSQPCCVEAFMIACCCVLPSPILPAVRAA